MGKDTYIEYCDSTINPVMGCDGCELYNKAWPDVDNICYAADLINRWKGRPGYPREFTEPTIFKYRFDQANKWGPVPDSKRDRKPWLEGYPRIIFWGDLADMWTESLDPLWLLEHLEGIEKNGHLNLFLTKRPKRMFDLFVEYGRVPENIALGVSVTHEMNVRRMGQLIRIGGLNPGQNIKLWLSLEPLATDLEFGLNMAWFDFVVLGFASGSKAVPMSNALSIARSIRDQCEDAETSFFFKQWGEFIPVVHSAEPKRVGKKNAGRLLDGVEHTEMPEAWK